MKSRAVVQSSGDKGMNQFFCIWKAESGAKFGNNTEVIG